MVIEVEPVSQTAHQQPYRPIEVGMAVHWLGRYQGRACWADDTFVYVAFEDFWGKFPRGRDLDLVAMPPARRSDLPCGHPASALFDNGARRRCRMCKNAKRANRRWAARDRADTKRLGEPPA